MRVHVTDQLFGLEAFSRPMRRPTDPPTDPQTDPQTDPPADPQSELVAPDASSTDVPDRAPEQAASPEVEELRVVTAPAWTLRSLVGRGTVLGLLLFILIAVVGLSLFTLSMKTRKKAASYELAHQTRLFRRMSKHRAIYELEYAYHRSSSPILEEFTRQGWREITPHDLTYIPVKKSVPRGRQELTW